MFLQSVDEVNLPLSEQARWKLEFEQSVIATEQWATQNNLNFTPEEIHYLVIMKNPKFWAAETLKWFSRDYQEPMLYEMANSKRTVLRLGRRLGKTETMCISILWHAFTQPNIGPNGQYNILIIAPFDTQIDLIFDRLSQLIDMSSDVTPSRDIHHRIELPNGTIITGLTAGSKSGNGAANTRGQRADLIVIDEADYMGESEITNIMNIRNEAPERIKMIVASTPAGRRDSYYKWCVGATKSYAFDEVGTKKNNRVSYNMFMKPYVTNQDGSVKTNPETGTPIREGNGWTTIHAPSTVNPELLKVNPDTGLTYIEELKLDLTEMRFVQEVLAEFGESSAGVFLKKHIDHAVERGYELNVQYYETAKAKGVKKGPRILGVDWDKKAADTNMVGVEWDAENECFVPFYRKVIPRGEFTYTEAVEEIKRADRTFEFDYIMLDAGHGEFQIEQIRKYEKEQGIKKGVGSRIVRVNLSEKVKVWDTVSRAYEKKHIKPFIVNNAVLMFERGMMALNPRDKDTISQFESYEVKSWSSDGRPTYTDENEHILDCIVFALYGFTKYFDDIMKVTKTARVRALKEPLDKVADNVVDRSLDAPQPSLQARRIAASLGLKANKNVNKTGRNRIRRGGQGMPTRKSF